MQFFWNTILPGKTTRRITNIWHSFSLIEMPAFGFLGMAQHKKLGTFDHDWTFGSIPSSIPSYEILWACFSYQRSAHHQGRFSITRQGFGPGPAAAAVVRGVLKKNGRGYFRRGAKFREVNLKMWIWPKSKNNHPKMVIKGSWEAILPSYGQIEFWDLKWWRVVCHLTMHNKRIRSYAVDLDEGW